jgi:transposase
MKRRGRLNQRERFSYRSDATCDSLLDVSRAEDIESLKAALAQSEARAGEACARADQAEQELASAKAYASSLTARLEQLEFKIAKLRRENFGPSSEKSARILEELEETQLLFEDLATDAAEEEIAAEEAAAKAGATTTVKEHVRRRRPAKKPFPPHLPRERVVAPSPEKCPCCGSHRLRKLGEDVTETLEVVPRRWKVVQTVREKFTCRDCEKITQPLAPFHVIARGHVGPSLLAMILFEKYAQHQPLNRQSERYEREGIDLSVSTLADHVGSAALALEPLHDLIEKHVMDAARIHGDDTTVPVLAKGKTRTGRLWTYVRDDAPFGGPDPPAAVFYYSRDRSGEHPQGHLAHYKGILQADAYAGFNALYKEDRPQGKIMEAGCFAHARRKFFELVDVARKATAKVKKAISPLALEALRRIDAIFAHEREINGLRAEQRLAYRRQHIAPLTASLEEWMRKQRAKLSRHAEVAKAMDYMLKRWGAFTRFLEDGRICLTNNAAERVLRKPALGRRNWLFVGSDRGGRRTAQILTLLATARLNEVDELKWLADVLARIAEHPINRLHELLPWNWKNAQAQAPKAA